MTGDIISEPIRKSLILETEKEIAQLRNALGAWEPGDNSSLSDLMPALRAAWLIVRHDQLTVRDIAKKLDNGDDAEASDALRQTLDSIEFAAGAFRQLADLCSAAEVRVKVHADAISRATA